MAGLGEGKSIPGIFEVEWMGLGVEGKEEASCDSPFWRGQLGGWSCHLLKQGTWKEETLN